MIQAKEVIRIPQARVGVVIGKDGEVKKRIEQETNTKITIDSEEGNVTVETTEETEDPLAAWKARDIIMAIARGFNPKKAFRLLEEDEAIEVIELSDFVGRSENALNRIRGRLIGENGKTRRIIEELTGGNISIYGRTVSIIGEFDQLSVAKETLILLINGAQHRTVYRFLHRKSRELKRARMELWKPRVEVKDQWR
ncbi:MAG: KH domain-containing protein [Candidatus Atabeyarchaeum deiterrae]